MQNDYQRDRIQLIESTRPGSAEAAQLGADRVAAQHPTLVILSLSDFGLAGAYARWQATAPVLDALGGGLARSGLTGRPPLLPPGNLAIECALVQAAYVALLGYVNRLKSDHFHTLARHHLYREPLLRETSGYDGRGLAAP